MSYSAGILPYAFIKSNLSFLLGKEKSGWSGFSGKCESCDNGEPVRTALREFHEETCNIFKNVIDEHFLDVNSTECVESITPKGNKFYLYILNIESAFDKTSFNSYTISEEFSHVLSSQTKDQFKEKSYIRFFSIHMLDNIRLRRYFKDDIDRIISIIKK